jgi:hypothetical protein
VILVNHALAHADDLDDAIAGLAEILAPSGVIALETHHALGLIRGGQFDIVSHAHRSYLSLAALEHALARHELVVREAVRLDLHGGTLRLLAGRGGTPDLRPWPAGQAIEEVRALEEAAGLHDVAGYAGLGPMAARACGELRVFLDRCHQSGELVVAYGAPTRGTTLLNAAGVTSLDVPFTVDRSPAKQGMLLPGSRIPIRPPHAIEAIRPAFLVVLPWPLLEEISDEMSAMSTWGGKFVVPLPSLAIRAAGMG